MASSSTSTEEEGGGVLLSVTSRKTAAAEQEKGAAVAAPRNNTVVLDVGGTPYTVSKSLLDGFPHSMLARLTSEMWNASTAVPSSSSSSSKKQEEQPIFIERNGNRFQYVLDYMRDGQVTLPSSRSVTKESILKELDYFGVTQQEEQQDDDTIEDCIRVGYSSTSQAIHELQDFRQQKQDELGVLRSQLDYRLIADVLFHQYMILRCKVMTTPTSAATTASTGTNSGNEQAAESSSPSSYVVTVDPFDDWYGTTYQDETTAAYKRIFGPYSANNQLLLLVGRRTPVKECDVKQLSIVMETHYGVRVEHAWINNGGSRSGQGTAGGPFSNQTSLVLSARLKQCGGLSGNKSQNNKSKSRQCIHNRIDRSNGNSGTSVTATRWQASTTG